jgi:hypothetical protein
VCDQFRGFILMELFTQNFKFTEYVGRKCKCFTNCTDALEIVLSLNLGPDDRVVSLLLGGIQDLMVRLVGAQLLFSRY